MLLAIDRQASNHLIRIWQINLFANALPIAKIYLSDAFIYELKTGNDPNAFIF